jgi:NAD(P)-dependent dehydrogenase (short-subunit alcohol dehydrogenase family)
MSFSKVVVIFSISSDIGYELAKSRLESGWKVLGTYRKYSSQVADIISLGGELVFADFESREGLKLACEEITKKCSQWDELIVAPGTLEPIGFFERCNFESWAESININFINQLYVVHQMLASHRENAFILFFAGGGTNSAADRFSAYTVSKIALIKMTELLDSEISDIRFSILGPGWINTKIHNETLKAKELAGGSFDETVHRQMNNNFGSIEDVVKCINWLSDQNKKHVGGRNFSVQNDAWGTAEFDDVLINTIHAGKLRRFANDELSAPKLLV